ncbi:FMN-binding glutamate synthase family protein [Lacimicrobium alkaliphilum]|uniref:FMN-binding glutamate synthase family protein n=1 Tax=Lacimicrobium alkaliphilum TaxID=1526571 RepID=A0ABQ1RHD4_9ALTE|nr:FMN-binding glutamate synthase family protein [Lacimicrobium alkaliphilum]GGD68241.1 FMN-binding glutamate synthase family protein [Lacimicrobium alkaliphilum]
MQSSFFAIHLSVFSLLGLTGLLWPWTWWLLLLPVLTLLVGLHDMYQPRHTLLRNFPLIGRGRWIMESLRPFVRQYLVESDLDGTPISRMFRSIVYQRAKGVMDSLPYGTRLDTYTEGYEWISHSIAALNIATLDANPRVVIGSAQCKRPYSSSILNISAMSFGALSNNAVLALNKGAKLGGFSHNTGEGAISDYHLQHGGDLVWQIGTGYFGCRKTDGSFDPDSFKKKAGAEQVKMIEIKLSQGAKPGHGGILPAGKNTAEIARIRLVEPHQDVISPSAHSAFSTPVELLEFVEQLRDLSGGKPVGIKLCVGRQSEFIAICKAMIKTAIKPDFITVDGGEGGTGAAPLEYSNSLGMPLRDAIAFVDDCLTGFGIRQEIRIIASGKIFSAFHMMRAMALGADLCNSGRGMMLALGCVQSLVCNTNRCPTGVATQDKRLVRGLDVTDKGNRVARYHKETLRAAVDMASSCGLTNPGLITRSHVFRRVDHQHALRFDQLYPSPKPGSLLTKPYPQQFERYLEEASEDSFIPRQFLCDSC